MSEKQTILAVDDSSDSLSLLHRLLNRAGYSVRLAQDGPTALKIVEDEAVDLILLDVRMPGMGGLEVCKALKDNHATRGIPVLLMSAFGHVKDWVEGLKLGAADYIDNALQEEELLSRVGTHLALARAQQIDEEAKGLRRANAALEAEIARRKLAEHALRQWADAFEHCAYGIALGLPENNKLLVCNPALARMLGRTVEDLAGAPILALHSKQDHALVVEKLAEADKQGQAQFECRLVRGDNQEFLVQMDVVSVRGPKGTPLYRVTTVQDLTERRRAEEALRLSEARYRSVLENSTEAIFVGTDSGIILSANPAACEMFGYSEVELCALNRDHLLDFTDPRSQQAVRILEQGSSLHAELPMVRRDGERFEAELTITRFEASDGNQLASIIIRDITHRRRLEAFREALLNLGSELNSTQDPVGAARAILNAADRLWRWDAATLHLIDPENNSVTRVLVLDTDETGIRREYPDQPHNNLSTPLMRRVMTEGATLVLRDREAFSIKAWTPFGNTDRQSASIMSVPIRRETKTVGILSLQSYNFHAYTNEDLKPLQALADYCGGALDRIRSEKDLERSEERYRGLVETTFDLIWEVDADGRYTYCSPKIFDVLGYLPEEVLGRTPFELMPPDEAERVLKFFQEIAGRGEPFSCLENINYHKSGRAVVLESSGVPVFEADGKLRGYRGMDRDITERKRAEHFRRVQHKLAQQLAAQSDLLEGLQLCLNAAIDAARVDSGACYLLNAETGHLELKAHRGLSSDFLQNVQSYGPDTLQAKMVAAAKPHYVRYSDLEIPPEHPTLNEGIRFIGVIPLMYAERPIGCMVLSSHGMDDIPPMLREVTETIAAGAAHAIARLRAEEALRRSQADLLEAQRVAKVGNWSADLTTGVLRWSDELFRIFGVEKSEFDGTQQGFLSRVHPEDRARVWKASHQAQARHESFQMEYRVVTSSGKIKTVREYGHLRTDAAGKVIGLYGTAQDITEQKQAEEALVASERRFRTLVDSAPIGIFVQAGGTFVYANEAAARMLGPCSRAELLGKSVLDRFHPDTRSHVADRIQVLNIERRAVPTAEERCVRMDGTSFEAEFSAVPFEYDGYCGGLVFFQEVTERKRLETQLRQAQKLEAIGQLAGGVAHDFNNILAAMMMHIGLVQMNPALDEETREALRELDAGANRAATLTRQLLMFGRRSVLSMKPLDLNETVANLLKMLGRLIREDIQLKFEGNSPLPLVDADAGMLEQVLVNLVVNARDAMSHGGKITISTASVQFTRAEVQRNRDRREGRFVCLRVSDTGTGIPAPILKRIFEPFFTTKDPGKGTGLGLATVHGIVAQHKGWVELETEVGAGSTFFVYLPVLDKAKEPETVAPQVEPVRRGTETILLAEDDPQVRELTSHTLRMLGYRVYEAPNGQEAMRVWQIYGKEVDLLMTDMVMPEGMTGLELAQELRSMKPDLRVIISSGYSAEIVQSGAPTKAGIVYLPKPYEAKVLARVLRDYLDSSERPVGK